MQKHVFFHILNSILLAVFREMSNLVLQWAVNVSVTGFVLLSVSRWFVRIFLACRSRQASIVLERYFRTEVSLLYIYACERDGPI